jgi:predicted lipid-binding transport protein (Tim44 family)
MKFRELQRLNWLFDEAVSVPILTANDQMHLAMNTDMDSFTLVLLVGAVLVFWLLRSVLGRRTGFEKPAPDFTAPAPDSAAKKYTPPEVDTAKGLAVEPVWKGHVLAGTAEAKGLEEIAQVSREFDVQSFLGGARAAYEIVLEAYAKGDKRALKPLLSRDVFSGFSDAIDARAKKGEIIQFQFVSLKSANIRSAGLDGSRATIGVRFLAEVISATRDASGRILEGDEKSVRELSDDWVFERDVRARDPNWILVSTEDNAD